MGTKEFENVVLPYLVMSFNYAADMPKLVSKNFNEHHHNLETGANGLAFTQDFCNTSNVQARE